ncbi:MAG: riboflavin synthase [Thermaerobacter sp.]|nr:riboflavin synthase [Thermaerobacter sp.]
MFTGIVEDLGEVREMLRRGRARELLVRSSRLAGELAVGDSVAVDGVCLTATWLGPDAFRADLSPLTAERTTLGEAGPGRRVNLEAALRLGGRLGGHLVTGHVDGVGTVRQVRRGAEEWELEIAFPGELAPYLVPRGSVAVDGVSLTVAAVDGGSFRVQLIPHTARHTTLGERRVGDRVNLEGDLLGKYVLRARGGGGITLSQLAEQGF